MSQQKNRETKYTYLSQNLNLQESTTSLIRIGMRKINTTLWFIHGVKGTCGGHFSERLTAQKALSPAIFGLSCSQRPTTIPLGAMLANGTHAMISAWSSRLSLFFLSYPLTREASITWVPFTQTPHAKRSILSSQSIISQNRQKPRQ